MPPRSLRTFTVLPQLPPRLQPLHKLAYNLWWTWQHDAVALFRRITDQWDQLDHSPVKVLGAVEQSRLEQLLHDEGFLAHMNRVEEAFDSYMNAPTWFRENGGPAAQDLDLTVAYLSAEFGIHESVPVYSGGLGVLSGDHLKSASDLGLPLVGVGLMYREGYFRQYLTVDGWQQERYPENDFFNLPLIPETRPSSSLRGPLPPASSSLRPPTLPPVATGASADAAAGRSAEAAAEPLVVGVGFPGREVFARVWRLQVGRVPLYLLDTNIPRNSPEDRSITGRLYGGDHDMRIRQEMILGIGGVRALRALGKPPTVCHMNEGHSAFCGLERIRELIERTGCDFAAAREAVSSGTVFTTHTPVPAGNDVFSAQLIEHYFAPFLPGLKIDRHEFLALGKQNPTDPNEPFGMTVLALRLANVANGVSALHGVVTRKMWKGVWPDLPEGEVPIISITNGVHTQSWVSPDMAQLYDRYLGGHWADPTSLSVGDATAGGQSEHRGPERAIWKRVEGIPDAELWRTHERRRERLVAFARARLKKQLAGRAAGPSEIARADEVLDPDALTIGFARRFATYKRGTLIFRNLERLTALINNKDRPVQFVFSGKAHPRDHGGKELIAEIMQFARRPEFRRRLVFLEDYDMNVARYLIQGVDVWLNNPRRPLEASGTSGMKVCANGGLNLSVLDGWWVEGYAGDNGWAIGAGEEYTDLTYQDDVESRAVYDLLEQEIVPLFYTRSSDGLPRGWLRMMKRSISTLAPVFSTSRMVAEYTSRCYLPSAARFTRLTANNLEAARSLAAWRRALVRGWPQVRVHSVEADGADPMHVGGALQVQAKVNLGPLSPDDVQVQLFHGRVDNMGEIPKPSTVPMGTNGRPPEGTTWVFQGAIPCRFSGQHGYTVRILPRHADLANPFEPGLVCWG
jgi:starch phosphorylase